MPPSTEGTGRIRRAVTPSARRLLFERDLQQQIEGELPDLCRIDRAHVLMLVERGIVPADAARCLLRAIERLSEAGFAPLRDRPLRRGLFLTYEEYLIETEGPGVGGLLQTGRSRNDLGATLARLRAREPYRRLLSAALRLQAVLLRRARRHAAVVMPGYTHGQPAEPITYGHYLAGLAEALRRDLDALLDGGVELDTCPLGAAALAGTSLPIDTARTAALLGFTRSSPNSLDAVASRDFALRLLASAAICATTLSRAATDLLAWLTGEFGFLTLPDELVGSSSIMPQKRNPFLLEHVQGRTASALGGFSAALAATRNAPFTNAIAVGTEALRPLRATLQDVSDALTLLRLVVAGAQPRPERMLQRAAESFTNATALALRLTQQGGMDFRSAHRAVGEAVTRATEQGLTSFDELQARGALALPVSLSDLDPQACVARGRFGGGPAPDCIAAHLDSLRASWREQWRRARAQAARWDAADGELTRACREFCEPGANART